MAVEFDFIEVPDEIREKKPPKKLGSRQTNPVFTKLLEGKTLFIEYGGEEEENKLNGFYESARRLGYRLNKRKVEFNGKQGHSLWLTKNE